MLEPGLKEQFIRAYDELADAIFRHCWFKVSDRELAKDLMQETFMKTWQAVSGGTVVDNLRAFLYRTANNLVIDHYRRHKAESLDALQEKGFDPAGADGDGIIRQAELQQMLAVVNQLPAEYREPLLLRYVDDLPVKAIAQVLAISENLVSVRLHRGVAKLKQTWTKN